MAIIDYFVLYNVLTNTKTKGTIIMNKNILNNQVSIKDILSLFQQAEKDMYIKDILPIFMNNKKLFAREATVRFYKSHLYRFAEYLEIKKVYTLRAINKQVLDDYVYYQKGKGNKNAYINKVLKALFNLIDFAEENEYISPMCFRYKRLPEEPAKIDIISDEDMKKIMRYLPGLSLNCQVMFLLLLSTGIRSNELVQIKIENIDFINRKIYLDKTKTKPRYTPLTDELLPLVKRLCDQSKSIWLFPKRDDKSNHIGTYSIRFLLDRIKKALNISVLSAHKLRHFYATYLLKSGVDIKTVSKLLGHTTIAMTERYLDITEIEMFEKNRINNPLKEFKL